VVIGNIIIGAAKIVLMIVAILGATLGVTLGVIPGVILVVTFSAIIIVAEKNFEIIFVKNEFNIKAELIFNQLCCFNTVFL